MNARTTAIARQDESIATNVAKIEATRRPSALDVMSSRLNISPTGLKNTLMATVFKKASDDEFAALIIVANAYNLNPLTKEIYAFPAKGGGIVPVVSIDGWIRIANEHPQMDGFETIEIPDDNGRLMACETTIWRKDRSKPIKMRAYLDECKMNTDPWKTMPARMLGHKSFIQCARYAFGFSGIYDQDDAMIGDISLGGDVVRPMRDVRQVEHQEEVVHDAVTGEVIDDQAIAEQLDRQAYAAADGIEPIDDREIMVNDLMTRIRRCELKRDFDGLRDEWLAMADALPEELYAKVKPVFDAAETRFEGNK